MGLKSTDAGTYTAKHFTFPADGTHRVVYLSLTHTHTIVRYPLQCTQCTQNWLRSQMTACTTGNFPFIGRRLSSLWRLYHVEQKKHSGPQSVPFSESVFRVSFIRFYWRAGASQPSGTNGAEFSSYDDRTSSNCACSRITRFFGFQHSHMRPALPCHNVVHVAHAGGEYACV